MPLNIPAKTDDTLPLELLSEDRFTSWIDDQPPEVQAWVNANAFKGALGQALALPGANGISGALVGFGNPESRARGRFHLAAGMSRLPAATYDIQSWPEDADPMIETLGVYLGRFRFDRYKSQKPAGARLMVPEGVDPDRLRAMITGEILTRDLINTPASDMGPEVLAKAASDLAERHGASCDVIEGEDLLVQNFPMIHTVGRAALQAPRLIDIRWGSEGPRLTLVGKGVCFDTGGLNLKPGGSMGLMKKDMGGAANVLGLAEMLMATGTKVQLRVLVPAVENSVSGNAFRPQDILTARNGLTVEINNTDAEGRLVLADALAYASEEKPDAIISMATLTGAARVAVGPDLAPFYCDQERAVTALGEAASQVADPVWRMPFHAPYEKMIEPGIADLDNAPKGGFAGSITAALFLRRFVTDTPCYMHFDIYGWQPADAPGRPKGGAAQGTRALLHALPTILDA